MDDKKQQQKDDRDRRLKEILKSKSSKRIIVAGPGTGKTFTLGAVLKSSTGNNKLVLTFIRRLVAEMESRLSSHAKIYTFHKYCKLILHTKVGEFEIATYLDEIIERDAYFLDQNLKDFKSKFENLEEGLEIKFYISRGDYYSTISFNDSVYRLLKLIQKTPESMPSYEQIVIDEFQDFNLLEVSLINELEKRSPILIVGDDDQAVYVDIRSASPDYLRSKHKSGKYEIFELPYSTRCTEAIVGATNSIINRAVKLGLFASRISKKYECYFDEKAQDNLSYPKIIVAELTNVATLCKYVLKEITLIPKADIQESFKEGSEYPTVLIIGPKQYLRPLSEKLEKNFPMVDYSYQDGEGYGLIDAYKELYRNKESNLGFRILAEIFLSKADFKKIISQTLNGEKMVNLLNRDFVDKHQRIVEIIKSMSNESKGKELILKELKDLDPKNYQTIISTFSKKEETSPKIIKDKPSIMLTSFVGSKGLSAGHVFIVGANNGSMPRNPNSLQEIEISQFIVALTRTRKQCQILSNRWRTSPKDKDGNWNQRFERSEFISWVPTNLIQDRGYLKAADI